MHTHVSTHTHTPTMIMHGKNKDAPHICKLIRHAAHTHLMLFGEFQTFMGSQDIHLNHIKFNLLEHQIILFYLTSS